MCLMCYASFVSRGASRNRCLWWFLTFFKLGNKPEEISFNGFTGDDKQRKNSGSQHITWNQTPFFGLWVPVKHPIIPAAKEQNAQWELTSRTLLKNLFPAL